MSLEVGFAVHHVVQHEPLTESESRESENGGRYRLVKSCLPVQLLQRQNELLVNPAK